jgi:hypothetical protein
MRLVQQVTGAAVNVQYMGRQLKLKACIQPVICFLKKGSIMTQGEINALCRNAIMFTQTATGAALPVWPCQK